MRKSMILAIATVAIWGTNATVIKIILTSIPTLQTLGLSGLCAFLFLLGVNLLNGNLKKMREYGWKDYLKMAGLGFLGLFLYSALYYYGLDELSAQMACIINYLWPIMLVMFSCLLLHEKLTLGKCAALLISFLGVIILSLGGQSGNSGNFTGGVIGCIIAAACYGLFSVLNKKADMDQNITMMVIWLTVTVCSLVLGRLTEDWIVIKGSQWIGLIYLGIFTDAIAYLMWALALKDSEEAAIVSNIAYLTPILSVIISAIVLKEKISRNSFIAFIMILLGIVLQKLEEFRREKS